MPHVTGSLLTQSLETLMLNLMQQRASGVMRLEHGANHKLCGVMTMVQGRVAWIASGRARGVAALTRVMRHADHFTFTETALETCETPTQPGVLVRTLLQRAYALMPETVDASTMLIDAGAPKLPARDGTLSQRLFAASDGHTTLEVVASRWRVPVEALLDPARELLQAGLMVRARRAPLLARLALQASAQSWMVAQVDANIARSWLGAPADAQPLRVWVQREGGRSLPLLAQARVGVGSQLRVPVAWLLRYRMRAGEIVRVQPQVGAWA